MPYSTFATHLESLPPEQARHGPELQALVTALARVSSQGDLANFLFLPDQTDHPEYEDAAEVFARAVDQVYSPKPWVGDEIALLFVGYHAMNGLTGKRSAQGLLLTDQAMYVQDEFTMMLAAPIAQGHALPERADDAGPFLTTLLARFKAWNDWCALADESEDELRVLCREALEPVVAAVADYHAKHGSKRQPVQRDWTLAGLIADHSAADTLLDPANPKLAKKLGKLTAKFEIPAGEALQFALADLPLFGGPYGVALTDQALYSKDLMETPLRLALDTLDAHAVRMDDEKKDQLLTATNQPITLPAHMESALRVPFFEFLKQEITRLQATS